MRNPAEVYSRLIKYYVNAAPPEVWENEQKFIKDFVIKKLAAIELFSE